MEAEEAKTELVGRLEGAGVMEVSLELVQGRGWGACCLLSVRGWASLEGLESRLPSGLPEGEAGEGRAGQA